MSRLVTDEEITAAQIRLSPQAVTARTRLDYRKRARWWELEARRGYSSSSDSLRYAANMRWAAELAGIYGNETWLELSTKQAQATADALAKPKNRRRRK